MVERENSLGFLLGLGKDANEEDKSKLITLTLFLTDCKRCQNSKIVG